MSLLFRAVLFDLDGTLADSLADIAGAMNHTLAARGLPTHPDDRYRQWVGEGLEVLAARALPPTHQSDVEALVREYRSRYAAHFADRTRLYPGIAELLDELAVRRIPIAILSNKRDDFTVAMVRALFSKWSFAAVRGHRVGAPRKPDPTAALQIATELRVDPAACAFVGDTSIDVETALAAGMIAVGAGWGFRGTEELEAAGAQLLLRHPAELLTMGRAGLEPGTGSD